MKTFQTKVTVLATALIFIVITAVWAQVSEVSGVVKDASDGSPVIGCTVQVLGTSRATMTDLEGRYSIKVSKGETLVFQFVGYLPVTEVVKSSVLNVKLQPDSLLFEEECVAVGYANPVASCKRMVASISYEVPNTEEYKSIQENGFKQVKQDPLSTFSIDVDAASYSNMRRYLNQGEMPPADAIRTEELVNYFT